MGAEVMTFGIIQKDMPNSRICGTMIKRLKYGNLSRGIL